MTIVVTSETGGMAQPVGRRYGREFRDETEGEHPIAELRT